MAFANNVRDPEIVGYIRKLLLMALGFFILTTVIGIINVLDFADDFLYAERGIILFHLHAGTIAWISTGIACALIWAVSQDRKITEEYKSRISKFYKFWQAVIPTYALVILISFQFDFYLLLPIFGILTIIGFIWASYIAYTEKDNIDNFGVPHLSFVIGLAIAGYAGFIGMLLGVQYTIGSLFIRGDGIGSHAVAMEVGYVFVVVTGLIELFLKGENTPKLDKLGIAQPVFLMLSALSGSFGLLFSIDLLVLLYVPLELTGVIIFLIRMGPELVKLENFKDISSRFFMIAPIFLLSTVSIFIYIVIVYFVPGNLTDPYITELILALNHSILVGGASGSLFGVIAAFTVLNRDGKMEWADLTGFGLMYIGLIGFILGFIFQFALHSAILMGIGILILIVAYWQRLTK